MSDIKAITNNKENEQVKAAANAPALTTEEKTATRDPPEAPGVAVKQASSSSSSDDEDDKKATKDETLPKSEEKEEVQKDNAVETATASLKDPPKSSSVVVQETVDNEHVKQQAANQSEKDAPDQEAILHRPIKRARTAYFIFCESKRPAVVEQVRLYKKIARTAS